MRLSEIEKQRKRVHETKLYGESIVWETQRVADVLENIDKVVNSLDEEFEKMTGIVNKRDMSFLFVAVMLQSLRWILSPELKLPNMKSQELHISKEQRLNDNENNHKGGIYDGKSSGTTYEQKNLKKYKEKHEKKTRNSIEEFYNNTPAYRTWIEILSQPVPYDAMESDGNGIIPNIVGLNGFNKSMGQYKNIYGGNHHVATLGHDPVLGWIFGTANIMSSTITMMDFQSFGVIRGHTVRALNEFQLIKELEFSDQRIDYADRWSIEKIIEYCFGSIMEDSKRLSAAVVRQGIHFASDKYCKQGLPIPLVSAINPEKAQKLITKGWNSKEFNYLLGKDMANIGINAALALIINFIIKNIYLFCMESDEDEFELREVRIQKILTVSNLLVSSSNVLYAVIAKQISKLDIGGIGVAMLQLFQSKKFISNIKQEFIARGLEKEIMGTGNWMEIAMQEVYENEQ